MVSCDDTAWLEARLTATEASILKYEAAIDAVSIGQSYTLDTGQSRQVVTKANLTELYRALQALEARRDRLRAALGCAGGHSYGRASF